MSFNWIKSLLKPVAKRVMHVSIRPGFILKPIYLMLYHLSFVLREGMEWFERAFISTPMFLSCCESFGEKISCDKLPYVLGIVRIDLGNNIRISGKIDIIGSNSGSPALTIGNGVFIGSGTNIAVAKSVKIGDYVAIGAGTSITDTEGHDSYNPQRPIWEVPAGVDNVASVVIEDNVQIGQGVTILKGVTIGARSVIGTGTLVRSSVPPDSIVMGNPGRVVRKMSPDGDSKEKSEKSAAVKSN